MSLLASSRNKVKLTFQFESSFISVYTGGTVSVGATSSIVGPRTVANQINMLHQKVFAMTRASDLEEPLLGCPNIRIVTATSGPGLDDCSGTLTGAITTVA